MSIGKGAPYDDVHYHWSLGRRPDVHILHGNDVAASRTVRHLQQARQMSAPRILGVLLLAAGVVLIIIGVVASRSLADNLSSFFTGRLTDHTLWYIFGGIASAVVGFVLAIGVIGKERT
jgi:Protein of unknown function (DUF3185)